jgi:hypothetical protein
MVVTKNILSNIIQTIADAKGVDPQKLDLILDDYIEIDAVVQMINAGKQAWRLVFAIPEYTVTIWGDGSVIVEPGENSQIPDY